MRGAQVKTALAPLLLLACVRKSVLQKKGALMINNGLFCSDLLLFISMMCHLCAGKSGCYIRRRCRQVLV
jgi:hypothetical protein